MREEKRQKLEGKGFDRSWILKEKGMGLSSSSNESIELCIFDLKRGQHEGQELDKILFFFPAGLPFSKQLSVIGLSEGLITFTRIFSPETPCELIEAEKHSHVFHEPEPDIWIVMVRYSFLPFLLNLTLIIYLLLTIIHLNK